MARIASLLQGSTGTPGETDVPLGQADVHGKALHSAQEREPCAATETRLV
jgi:hypothetical protein